MDPYKPKRTRDEINQYLTERDEDTLLMDGFDDALIGFSQRINEPLLAVYSYEEMVKTCIFRDGMTDEEAEEYIEFNCIHAWVGEQTPVIVRDIHR